MEELFISQTLFFLGVERKIELYQCKEIDNSEFGRYLKMRKCIRCDVEMLEDYDVKVEGGAYGLKITKLGIFKDNLGKVHASVCSECGYLEFYLEDTAKIKK